LCDQKKTALKAVGRIYWLECRKNWQSRTLISVKEAPTRTRLSLAQEAIRGWTQGLQACAGAMKPNLISALIQRGALRLTLISS